VWKSGSRDSTNLKKTKQNGRRTLESVKGFHPTFHEPQKDKMKWTLTLRMCERVAPDLPRTSKRQSKMDDDPSKVWKGCIRHFTNLKKTKQNGCRLIESVKGFHPTFHEPQKDQAKWTSTPRRCERVASSISRTSKRLGKMDVDLSKV
jgi:hypothetical protein